LYFKSEPSDLKSMVMIYCRMKLRHLMTTVNPDPNETHDFKLNICHFILPLVFYIREKWNWIWCNYYVTQYFIWTVRSQFDGSDH
jgi:hypothetical protein